MKRTIVILALVAAFVLAFSAVAQARWNGFTPVRTPAQLPAQIPNPDVGQPNHNPAWAVGAMVPNPNYRPVGFITFTEAQAEMARNFALTGDFGPDDPGAGLQGTAHGGYVTTTTKCVVCHSAHRATGTINNPDGSLDGLPGFDASGVPLGDPGAGNANRDLRNQNQDFLTAGSNSCAECHVAWGSQGSRLLVEWGQASNGGPHAYPARGCTMCHNSGIHGLSNSDFNVMNVFMLGNTRRGSNPASDSRDDQIRAEMDLWTGYGSNGAMLMQVPGEPGANISNTWWYDGNRSLGPVGGRPTLTNGNELGAAFYGAARSMATAYTCSEAGCHVRGAFFTLNWGVGFDRLTVVGPTITGSPNSTTAASVTGHVMPSARATGAHNGGNQACGPCHAGNPAGFPTASTVAGQPDLSRRAYGCDQCHDMVGVATNSTAWPHGNRNIAVYEWLADGTQLDGRRTLDPTTGNVIDGPNMIGSRNLWMYGGNIARSADVTSLDRSPGLPAGFNEFTGPDSSDNPNFADHSWRVLTQVTRGVLPLPDAGTGLTDGSCLKCHVAMDTASLEALNSQAADALAHSWGRWDGTQNLHNWGGNGTPLNPTWDSNYIPTGSGRLFLYR